MAGARLTLASRSPQRRAILEQLGIAHDVAVPEVEELTEVDPEQMAAENARRKARAVSAAGGWVLAADTVVALDGQPYGKPASCGEARAMLKRLAGQTHRVHSGIAVIEPGGAERSAVATTEVVFRDLADAEIEAYVDSGEWEGRAGGYAIQGRGAVLVERIAGDYANVVGLPVAALVALAPELMESSAL